MNLKPAQINECVGPLWKPKLWEEINKDNNIKYSNCYTYAFNYVDYGNQKLQPGELHGTKYEKNTCGEIIRKVKNDYIDDNIVETDFETKLPSDRYKIALTVDLDFERKDTDKYDPDYHFYRQDCNGTWSHKPGTNDVTNEDADGNAILNPEEANRSYRKVCEKKHGEGSEKCEDKHNYHKFCGFLSIPINSFYGPVIRYKERNRSEERR